MEILPAHQFQSTTNPKSERLLAHSLGYPKGWHVVRIVPHPSDQKDDQEDNTTHKTFLDVIHAGDPSSSVDTFYNHSAAYEAALDWKEGESDGYEKKGGQMLPQVAAFKKKDTVEVYYEPEDKWYDATILKVTSYEDDIRYTVHYTDEDSKQTNVCEEDIRIPIPKIKKSKKKQAKLPFKLVKNSPKKNKAKNNDKDEKPKTPNEKSKKIAANPEDLKLALEMGLPDGWTAKLRPNSKYTFCSPDGNNKFSGIKKVFQHLGLPMPTTPKSSMSDSNKKRLKGKSALKANMMVQDAVEEGDPPWRQEGHQFMGKRVKYITEIEKGGFGGKSGTIEASGTVTGWIASTDVDKNGEPGFISEASGKPAALFHVVFDSGNLLASQDLEEYELMEFLVEDNDNFDNDGDDDSSSKPKSKRRKKR
mmetsp:Transcript_21284/g.29847  ORF Transcript_21284/g.29847 Transcript_21284/m.29847 type:complete len:419 (+) Transcript_21284:205-1461(+)|eukprot:CAMPEP_0184864568 /NCGR_PEP_ID=MMETSP0580-20130426/15421_1 /TAXON_ID=1118495 /ORGANISM="Dactyliosolen fragilissimus" /LENGTH=418 /DNA_ID=CAMNT_0027363423 /DNA_START=172 /DNA_END=1428 /DNA_ORIENTATION=+